MCRRSVGLVVVVFIGVGTVAVDGRAETTIAPDLTIAGSTTGDSKLAAAAALWFVPSKSRRSWTADSRPQWVTLALDLSVTLNDGSSSLLRDTEVGGFSSGTAWKFGASVGYVEGYSANDVLGPATTWIQSAHNEYSARIARAAEFCSVLCKENDEAPGCRTFEAQEKQLALQRQIAWGRKELNLSPSQPPTADQIKSRMEDLVPSPGAKCDAAIKGWGDAAKNYVDAREKKVALEAEREASAGNTPPHIDAKLDRIEQLLQKALPAEERETLQTKKNALKSLMGELEKGLKACAEECRSQSISSTTCDTVARTEELRKAASTVNYSEQEVDIQTLCTAEAERIRRIDSEDSTLYSRLRGARYQRVQVSAGGSIGTSLQEFLEIVGQIPDETGALVDSLETRSVTYAVWELGASAAGVPLLRRALGFSYEARGLYNRAVEAQETQGQWCEPSGIVGDQTTDPVANSCTTRPVGSPSRKQVWEADLRIGYAHLKSGAVRFAVGPRYAGSVAAGDTEKEHTLGIRLPLYINFLAVPRNNQKLDYEGLVRVSFFFDHTVGARGSNATSYAIGATLALLGRRSMFSTKYNEL